MSFRIAAFCIPAHGHTNPMLPVVAELVRRGDTVRFYSFGMFEEKIRNTGAEFVSCNRFLGELTDEEKAGLSSVSSTELTIQDIRITLSMDGFLKEEFGSFRPDIVYSDAVCFWGKLNAWKYQVPLVVSTSTFAFNRMSSSYMQNSPGEMFDLISGLPKVSKELKKLEPYGYHVRNALSLIQNDNDTDTVVYTSRRFQPYPESFSDHYLFAGPSVFSKNVPDKNGHRPVVYISMGTVINDRPDFYRNCIEALRDTDNDVIISCGNAVDIKELGELPENVSVYSYVDQMDVLCRANVFVTHCGMNSVSESMYMATPMVLYPQTNEQKAVARRAEELGAGKLLRDDSAEGIRAAVLEILRDTGYSKAAEECRKDFLSCPGTTGAADFIESAPHESDGKDIIKELNRSNTRFTTVYTLAYIAVLVALKLIFGWKHLWIAGVILGILGTPIGNVTQNRRYRKILENHNSGN